MFGLTKEELLVLKKLNTPRKVQDFLNKISINFEEDGDTCLSPRCVLRERRAHCVEGAMLAALALRVHGQRPLVLDLSATKEDQDHVVALFKKKGCWGAISKTNHAMLRYREPVYRTIRELVMSYFHEYFLDSGKKTLRRYSLPVDLARFDKLNWMTNEQEVWFVPEYLVGARHYKVVSKKQARRLRKADPLEVDAGKLVEW
ncbi:MAG TPA: hypothetical protein VFE88_00805 [Candidatus Nanoarchaeia archaeon]|nr:hypothetical protein [Candidatus Nanoarchaeia archaeon]